MFFFPSSFSLRKVFSTPGIFSHDISFRKKYFLINVFPNTRAWGGIWNLSANAMKDCRNLLSRRSLSNGSLGSITWTASICNSSPLSGIPRAWPIVSNSWGSLLLKLIWVSKGCELDKEKRACTRILACRIYLRNVSKNTWAEDS